jgi:hypothetical protein
VVPSYPLVSPWRVTRYAWQTAARPHRPNRIVAQALSKQRVYMNAVDTGWINDENPLEKVGYALHLALCYGGCRFVGVAQQLR